MNTNQLLTINSILMEDLKNARELLDKALQFYLSLDSISHDRLVPFQREDIKSFLDCYSDYVSETGKYDLKDVHPGEEPLKNFLEKNQSPKNEANPLLETILQTAQGIINVLFNSELSQTELSKEVQQNKGLAREWKRMLEKYQTLQETVNEPSYWTRRLQQTFPAMHHKHETSTIQDESREEIEEKVHQHKNNTCVGEEELSYSEFRDLWAKNNTSFDCWLSLSQSSTEIVHRGFSNEMKSAWRAYSHHLENKHKRKNEDKDAAPGFVAPEVTPNMDAAQSFHQTLIDSGYNEALATAFDTSSGLRVLVYRAGVHHLAISHPDRLPTLREIQWCRDYFLQDKKQMAIVIPANEKPVGESGNNTVTLIELLYAAP